MYPWLVEVDLTLLLDELRSPGSHFEPEIVILGCKRMIWGGQIMTLGSEVVP